VAKASRFGICAVEAIRWRCLSNGYPGSRLQPARGSQDNRADFPRSVGAGAALVSASGKMRFLRLLS
jgi:hypothetical protein